MVSIVVSIGAINTARLILRANSLILAEQGGTHL